MDYDITTLLAQNLEKERRPPDGLLHPSGDLIGPLRHTMLRAAGAPTIENHLISEVRLATGTAWHHRFENVLRGLPGMFEVNLTKWLPEGWSGTADWLLWDDAYKAFVLHDLKTIKGDGLKYILYEGPKEEHRWQLSAYWHALVKMGLPLLDIFKIYYLPMDVPSDKPDIEPMLCEVEPIEHGVINDVMEFRWEATQTYLDSLPFKTVAQVNMAQLEDWVTDKLADEPERVQGVRYNKLANQYDVKLLPHWTTRYCPFPDELCSCRHQKTEKIGHYLYDWAKESFYYVPRKGYQAITPKVELTYKMKATMEKNHHGSKED